MIIVSLTSWPKRIFNVPIVLKNILNGTLKPDYIELNLSSEEFPNKEDDLPKELLEIEKLNINWEIGNSRTFKKIIPTLKKSYKKEYYLLSIDDDWIYSLDYIERMVYYLNKYSTDTFCLANAKVIGNRQIYKSSCFSKDFWDCLTENIIKTGIDDAYIEHYLLKHNKTMSYYRPDDVCELTKVYNEISPLHDEYNQPGRLIYAEKIIKSINFNE